jgi:hypothetical protein
MKVHNSDNEFYEFCKNKYHKQKYVIIEYVLINESERTKRMEWKRKIWTQNLKNSEKTQLRA